jgi:rhomboid protease GluP
VSASDSAAPLHNRASVPGPSGWFVRAPFTRAVMTANVALFALGVVLARSVRAVALLPKSVLYTLGMCDALAVFGERRFETLVTSCFVHASLLHLLFNLYALWQLGPPIERAVGTRRMASVYLASGTLGAITSALVGWLGQTPRTSEGASGALCGLIGAALVLGLRTTGLRSSLAWSMARWLGLLVAVQVGALALRVETRFDNAAHFGAALAGATLGGIWPTTAPAASAGSSSRRSTVAWSAAAVGLCFLVCAYRERTDPFATLGVTDRYDLASLLIRSGQCKEGRAALDATARLLPNQPTVIGLETEWHRACAPTSSVRVILP